MTTNSNTQELQGRVEVADGIVHASIEDRRPQSVGFFETFRGDLDSVVQDIWRVGLGALSSAHAQMETAKLDDVATEMLQDLETALSKHTNEQKREVASLLETYFDSRDGKLPQRLDSLVKDDGELARLLRSHLSGEGSTLARSLAQQVGENSPLFKLLSPTDSQGFLSNLEKQIESVLDLQRQRLLDQLDPRVEGSAIQRMLVDLREAQERDNRDRNRQFDSAIKSLDANDETSALSSLMRAVGENNQRLLSAINPEATDSPMAAIRLSVTRLLETHAGELRERLEAAEVQRSRFEAEVRTTLQKLESRRETNRRTPQGGREFEDAVVEMLHRIVPFGQYTVEATGTIAGSVTRRKIGDAVVTFGQETAFPGARIVFEAKQDSAYSVSKALDELEGARENRDACVGVLVLAQSHAPSNFPEFARCGRDVIVTWDDADPASDIRLRCAVELSMALAVRQRDHASDADVALVSGMEKAIEKRLRRITVMKKAVKRVIENGQTLEGEVRELESDLGTWLSQTRKALTALQSSEHDRVLDRSHPISFPQVPESPEPLVDQVSAETPRDSSVANGILPWPDHGAGAEAAGSAAPNGQGTHRPQI